jgi:hypothetical protein
MSKSCYANVGSWSTTHLVLWSTCRWLHDPGLQGAEAFITSKTSRLLTPQMVVEMCS